MSAHVHRHFSFAVYDVVEKCPGVATEVEGNIEVGEVLLTDKHEPVGL